MLIAGGLLLLALISGYLTHGLGRPLNTALFTVHKLSAVAAIVFAVLAFVLARNTLACPSPTGILIAISLLLLVVLLVTGGFLSFERFADTWLATVHTLLGPATAVLWVVALVVFWLGGR